MNDNKKIVGLNIEKLDLKLVVCVFFKASCENELKTSCISEISNYLFLYLK